MKGNLDAEMDIFCDTVHLCTTRIATTGCSPARTTVTVTGRGVQFAGVRHQPCDRVIQRPSAAPVERFCYPALVRQNVI